MAIDMISEAPSLVITSPRISFSDDICNKDASIEDFPHRSDTNSDFDFCISNITNTETCSADELFLDGLIRPLQLQEKFVRFNQQVPNISKTTQTLSASPSNQPTPNDILKQNVTTTRRSSSLHCVNGTKKSSFWSLPILSRSNSTGSVPNSKNSTKQKAQLKQMNGSSQKPPLRKNYGHGGPNYYGNGVSINPVLNVPPTFIPKGTANLFGLGSFFANGKEKKSKK
ncbi:hypothetical protein RND71_026565 [Anisodus tanguticus]|uniref:Uncharacterized protein n=1 Tax=Anisodus tanguticus TaxID=243964 RepID=A0AAE1V8F5_9SOLA|nr:hypothetical protein RND71_026565 [Anisodus tanguticus]